TDEKTDAGSGIEGLIRQRKNVVQICFVRGNRGNHLASQPRSRHKPLLNVLAALSITFIGPENERFVSAKRAADRTAELVEGERSFGGCSLIPGVQRRSRVVLEDTSMPVVGSGLGQHVDVTRESPSVFRGDHSFGCLHLADSIESDKSDFVESSKHR